MFVGFSALSYSAFAAEFVANQVKKFQDTEITSRIYMKDKKMRMEMKMPGTPMTSVILIDREANTSIMLIPQQKMYMTVPAGQEPDEMPDLEELKEQYQFEQKDLGEEKVNGYDCKKTLIRFKEKHRGEMTQWYSEKLGFLVKMISKKSEYGDMSMELTDIQEKKLDDSLFTVPPGYKDMSAMMGGMGGMRGMGGVSK